MWKFPACATVHNYIMKQKVTLSLYSSIITSLVICMLCIGLYATYGNQAKFTGLCIITAVLLVFGLWHAPVSISTDNTAIKIKNPIRTRTIPFARISSVAPFQPTMGAIRLCASGGFMGYWGLFRKSDIGTYTGCYGKASDCFLITLTNGDRYVLGCNNPDQIITELQKHISPNCQDPEQELSKPENIS